MKKYRIPLIIICIALLTGVFNINTVGAAETVYNGKDYSLVFDAAYYYNKYPDLQRAYGYNEKRLLAHFVENGMKEGRQGRESFDVKYYMNKYGDLRKSYGNNYKSYYLHYINSGYREGRRGLSETYHNGFEYNVIFDADFYYNKYEDVQKYIGKDKINLFNHFVNFGIKEGRCASAKFDVVQYLGRYKDLDKAFAGDYEKAVYHYLSKGMKEGRDGAADYCYNGKDYSLVYNKNFYLENNGDLQRAFGDNYKALIQHFVLFGMKEGRQAKESFDLNYYREHYKDLDKAYGDDYSKYYQHYMVHGFYEKRQASIYPQNGWIKIGDDKVYFVNCERIKGWHVISGRSYYFDDNGILKTKTGIDVSSHNGEIDWQKVKNDDISFAIIRVGYGGDYADQDDTMAIRNMDMCEKYGIPYGVYLYSYALTSENVESEIKHTLRMIKGRNPEIGVFFDMEDADDYKLNHGMPSQQALNDFCLQFMDAMIKNGYSTGTYASKHWFDVCLTDPRMDNYPIWLAQWYTRPTSNKNFIIWQYTSDGSVNGISGRVDMNVYMED